MEQEIRNNNDEGNILGQLSCWICDASRIGSYQMQRHYTGSHGILRQHADSGSAKFTWRVQYNVPQQSPGDSWQRYFDQNLLLECQGTEYYLEIGELENGKFATNVYVFDPVPTKTYFARLEVKIGDEVFPQMITVPPYVRGHRNEEGFILPHEILELEDHQLKLRLKFFSRDNNMEFIND